MQDEAVPGHTEASEHITAAGRYLEQRPIVGTWILGLGICMASTAISLGAGAAWLSHRQAKRFDLDFCLCLSAR